MTAQRTQQPWPPEGWGRSDLESSLNFEYSPVIEAENIAREAAEFGAYTLPGETEPLWEYTAVAFENLLAPKAENENQEDHYFSILPAFVSEESDTHIAVDWTAPGKRQRFTDGRELVGSIFFVRDSAEGKNVLSYSLFGGPRGPLITRDAVSYAAPFGTEMLDSMNGLSSEIDILGTPLDGLPDLSNNEVLSVVAYMQQYSSMTDSTYTANPDSSAFDTGGYGGESDAGFGAASESSAGLSSTGDSSSTSSSSASSSSSGE